MDNLSQASERYEAARYLLKVSFPAVQDPKLFIGILTNLDLALQTATDTLLRHTKGSFADNPAWKSHLLKTELVARYKINPQLPVMSDDIRQILQLHKESPVEFRRDGKMVICNEKYDLKILAAKDIEAYLSLTDEFIAQVAQITQKS